MRRPLSELPDENLIALSAQGHPEAFDEIVGRYDRRIINFLYRVVGDYAVSEELAQETFLRAYRAADRFDTARRFSTWLYTIARNLASNELRRRSRVARHFTIREDDWDHQSVQQLADTATGPMRRLEAEELRANLEQAMGRLSSDQRQALILAEYEGLPYREIAAIFDCPVGTIKAWIFRAKKRLMHELQEVATA